MQISRRLIPNAFTSIVKRFRRFVANDAVDTRAWYHPWATWLIQSAGSDSQINLVIDCSKVTNRAQLICIVIAYQRRTLPIAWDWVPHDRGHSTTEQQLALLRYVFTLIPSSYQVSLVGDSEFDNTALIEQLQGWDWDYVLRQMPRTKVLLKDEYDWRKITTLEIEMGDAFCHRHVLLTEKHALRTHLVSVWQKGEKEPWHLATNQASVDMAIFFYKRRMWIEEMFRHMKRHGFNLEASRLWQSDRLSRLMFVVAIVYVWLVTLGEYVIQNNLRAMVDRKDRQDLSIFRLGWDWLERLLALDLGIPLIFHPKFSLIPENEKLSVQRLNLLKFFGVR
ncbi:MAG: IS4 family transposase [Phototrophicaceae bacterium]